MSGSRAKKSKAPIATVTRRLAAARQRQPALPMLLHEYQKRAAASFRRVGLPTTKLEAWRYYPGEALFATDFYCRAGRAKLPDQLTDLLALFPHNRIVTVNGAYHADLSTPLERGGRLSLFHTLSAHRQRQIGQLVSIDRAADGLAALNAAYLVDGLYLAISPKARLKQPILLIHVIDDIAANTVCQPRVFIDSGEGSRASIIEVVVSFGDHDSWSNSVVEVVVGEKAQLHYYQLQDDAGLANMTQRTTVSVKENAMFTHDALSLRAASIRNDLIISLDGINAQADLAALYQPMRQECFDQYTTIDHRQPDTSSHQLYKGVVAGHAVANFNGTITVHHNAIGSDAEQQNHNIILSDNATVNTRPQLDIFADDVTCRHGATTGAIDDALVFYARSRGLDAAQAQTLILQGFTQEIIDHVSLPKLHKYLLTRLTS